MLSSAKACREGFQGACVRRYTEGKIYNSCWLGVAKLTNMQACVRHCEGLLDIERQVGIAESNLQMCEETKHIYRGCTEESNGSRLFFQQVICPGFFHCEGCAY